MAGPITRLPPAQDNQVYVTISALEGGQLTLPESLFITNAEPGKRATVPSLAFLIRHQFGDGHASNLVFDLGLKRDLTGYASAQQHHITQRQPVTSHPDVADTLRAGGLDPATDIDTVILSHVHWDHVGTSSDFAKAEFVVGTGTLSVLEHGAGPHYPAQIMNKDELPLDRTLELVPVNPSDAQYAAKRQTNHRWAPLASFPATVDFYGDGSLYIIDTPGHLRGHVNLLARIGERKWVFLGGDCCHDVRILHGESGIALYDDGHGGQRSVHMDTATAKTSLDRIKELITGPDADQVEVVIAHDGAWMERNRHKFFPGTL